MTHSSIERILSVQFACRVYFTRGIFSPHHRLLSELLVSEEGAPPARVLIWTDAGVARAFPRLMAQTAAYFAGPDRPVRLAGDPRTFPGGETAKNDRGVPEAMYREIERHALCRHSYILAVGGGAFLDVAGFTAATAHRGVRLVRVPTTSLSQADGGVGVKNGVNAFGKKNFIGTFAPPFAVINDADFLAGLPAREKRAGFIEAVKVALIRDAGFFEAMERDSVGLARFEPEAMERVIRQCAELHLRHIAESGDPFERGSARPLDFGHWAAHKLEQMSGFAVTHGDAVAVGVALDTLYSWKSGRLAGSEAERALRLIEALGFSLMHPLVENPGGATLLAGLEEFREHLGGRLTITLPAQIGRGVEVHEIDLALMRACVTELAERFRRAPRKP